MLYTSVLAIITWAAIFIWVWIAAYTDETMKDAQQYLPYTLIPLVIFVAVGLIWGSMYVKTVKYHLNNTEVSWKRGVLFHTTGIVPYNRITDITISQGPIMRMFGISHLKIQTAGGGTAKGVPEIQIEGQIFAEELRSMIMEYVRGLKNAGGATVGVAEDDTKTPVSNDELLNEVREIRKLLERKE